MTRDHVVDIMFKKYKEEFPELDETSFNWGWVAAINYMVTARSSKKQ